MTTIKNEQGWVIVDGVHCCYCQLADYACPQHGKAYESTTRITNEGWQCTICGTHHNDPDEWRCKYCKNGGE